jgi:hypothetical protein
VIGGLITSTVLSLLVIPSVFSYLDDLEGGIRRVVARVRGRKPEIVPEPQPAVQATGE